MATVPLAGWVTEAIVMGPPSMSVSLARTSIAVAPDVLGDRGRVVDRDRGVVDAGDGDRHGGRRAAVEGVGEGVGGLPALQ